MSTVIINPGFDAFYYSYYLHAIREAFGLSSIRFSSKPFPRLRSDCLSFIVRAPDGRERRVVVDAYDGGRITNEPGLAWCDVYGKVNLTKSLVAPDLVGRCVAIGPSCGIRLWSVLRSWVEALRHYRTSVDYTWKNESINSTREHFSNYRSQYRHSLPLSTYVPGLVRDDYVFFLATLWADEQAPDANENRAAFIASCRAVPSLTLEGGLVAGSATSASDERRFHPYLTGTRVPLRTWVEKTAASTVVFNTPAVFGCHGWKLFQYLALGKAIISTPLVRELPAPLVHERDVHFVDGSQESIVRAVQLIARDTAYRKRLEHHARQYFLDVLSPARVLARLLGAPVEAMAGIGG
jgi:hypothetical protein